MAWRVAGDCRSGRSAHGLRGLLHMAKRSCWWETKEYQLPDGHWCADASVFWRQHDGVRIQELHAPRELAFASRTAAATYSDSMAKRWIRERGWHSQDGTASEVRQRPSQPDARRPTPTWTEDSVAPLPKSPYPSGIRFATAAEGQLAVLRITGPGPVIRGTGERDYFCPECRFRVIEQMTPGVLMEMPFACPQCLAVLRLTY
jgi:hypothetical protein